MLDSKHVHDSLPALKCEAYRFLVSKIWFCHFRRSAHTCTKSEAYPHVQQTRKISDVRTAKKLVSELRTLELLNTRGIHQHCVSFNIFLCSVNVRKFVVNAVHIGFEHLNPENTGRSYFFFKKHARSLQDPPATSALNLHGNSLSA